LRALGKREERNNKGVWVLLSLTNFALAGEIISFREKDNSKKRNRMKAVCRKGVFKLGYTY